MGSHLNIQHLRVRHWGRIPIFNNSVLLTQWQHALRYKYDSNSRLTNRWSVAKGNTYYAYDYFGNLTNIDYPDGVSPRKMTFWV